MLSTEALKLHWARCLRILEMWRQSTNNTLILPGELHSTINKDVYLSHYFIRDANARLVVITEGANVRKTIDTVVQGVSVLVA